MLSFRSWVGQFQTLKGQHYNMNNFRRINGSTNINKDNFISECHVYVWFTNSEHDSLFPCPPPRITCDFLVLYACSNKGVPLRTPKPPPPEQSHNWSTQLLPLNVVIGTPRHSRLLRLRHVFITFCVIKFRSRTFGFLLQLNMHGNSSVARSLRLFSHAL